MQIYNKQSWIEEFKHFGDFTIYGNFITLILGLVWLKRLLWPNRKTYNFKLGGKLKRNKYVNLPYTMKFKASSVDPEMRAQTFDP